jgi:hypothetical protein
MVSSAATMHRASRGLLLAAVIVGAFTVRPPQARGPAEAFTAPSLGRVEDGFLGYGMDAVAAADFAPTAQEVLNILRSAVLESPGGGPVVGKDCEVYGVALGGGSGLYSTLDFLYEMCESNPAACGLSAPPSGPPAPAEDHHDHLTVVSPLAGSDSESDVALPVT